MKIGRFSFFISVLFSATVFAQDANNLNDKEAAYIRTITSRAEKIVSTLGISDSLKAKHITAVIADQYKNLNTVYTERDDQLKIVKQKGLPKEAADSEIKNIEASVDRKIKPLHTAFLSELLSELTPEQVTKVKDGMTYNVLKVT